MKKNSCLLVATILIGFTTSLIAQSPSALVPQGWKLLKQVDGDLNKDGKADAVLLISNPVPNEEGRKPRALAVLLKENSTYKLQYVADKPIPDEAPGILVDPTTAVKIENGFLILHYTGEAKEAEANLDVTSKFTYQDNDLFLILVSQKGKEGTKSYSSDYDLLTSKITIDKKDSGDSSGDGKTTLDRPKMPSLPPLKEFDPGMFSMLLHMISVK